MRFFFQIIVVGLSFIIAGLVIEGISVDSYLTALVAALVLAIVNLFIRPILAFMTAPLVLLSLGLFMLVINALTYWLTAYIIPGFEVDGFASAFLGALITSIVLTGYVWITKDKK